MRVIPSVELTIDLVDTVEVPQQIVGISFAAAIEERDAVIVVECDFGFATMCREDCSGRCRRGKRE